MASNALEWVQENREKAKLFVYFLLIVALALPVTRLVGQGYQDGNLINSLLRLTLFFDFNRNHVSLFFFGVYLGLLTLMTIDHKKRVQAALLWISTIIASVALASMGVFLPNVDPIGNFPWLLAGVVVGLVLGGVEEFLEFDSVQTQEFRRASVGVYLLITILVTVSFIEAHVQYPHLLSVTPAGEQPVSLNLVHENPQIGIAREGIVVNAVTAGLFVFVVNRFITYDADQNFFILGPRASGKSLFLIGAFLEAQNRARSDEQSTPLRPSQDLMSMIEELDRESTGWIVEATGRGELNELAFQYVHGSVFPTNIQLSSIDYAGEYLERLPDALTGIDDDEDDTTLERLVENIRAADTLILVIDVERFTNNEPLEIAQYFSILQAAEDKKAMLVATKADHLAEDFQEEEGLEPHLYYEDFVDFVNQRLRQNENVNALVTEVGGRDIHPVYYQTKVDEAGNKVPRRDETGSVMTVGFEQFLERLGRY